MSAIGRLRRRLGPTEGPVVRAFFELEAVSALLRLHEAVAAMAKARCVGRIKSSDDAGNEADRYSPDRDVCTGQYHAKDCPAAIARRAVLDLSGEIEGML